MNSLTIVLIAVVFYILGYRFYGKKLAKVFELSADKEVPSKKFYDGIDYVPARHWLMLFGHHFASIAGAGPILGPVIACAIWGWLPCAIWLIIGAIVIGAVHDFSSLMISLRHQGKSIADVSESVMGRAVRVAFAGFIWLSLILVMAVFAAVAGKTLQEAPQIVIPTFGLIPLAIFIGILIYRYKMNLGFASILGFAILFLLIITGVKFPVKIWNAKIWTFILLIYAYFAAIIPVNILLQPRDYLSTSILFFGILVGFVGLLITHPVIKAPAFTGFMSAKGPLFPMLMVIIACGAISGFHSLVSSGTTSKQLPSEYDAQKIGYGAMLAESALSILALLSVSAGLSWATYLSLMSEKGWIYTFGEGFGRVTKPVLLGLGSFVGMTMLNAFVLTTLDTATRITRYIGEELFKIRNRFLSTGIIVFLAGLLATGAYKKIWPVFGASNQLVAAIALLVVSVYLMNQRKRAIYTLLPSIFMFAVTITALILEAIDFYKTEVYYLFSISLILLLLAFFTIYHSLKKS